MEGASSQPQRVAAGKPIHVATGKLFSHGTNVAARLYAPAAAKVQSNVDHARSNSPSAEVSVTTAPNQQTWPRH